MSDNILTVSLVQYSPKWEDIHSNLSRLDELIRPLVGKTHLIVLPEMFPTGFSMNAGRMGSAGTHVSVRSWMQQQAVLTDAMIVGSMAVLEDGKYYNRLYRISPDGTNGYYDKHHLFTMSGEPKHFTAGTEQKRFYLRDWEINPVVCYDLRFPAWCRNTRTNPYDILVCPASWPSARSDVWITLLKARALENQCYVIGVNRTGLDGNGLPHKGDSMVFGPKGEIIGHLPENEETIASFDLSLNTLHDFRRKFPTLEDMDNFSF